MEYTTVDMTSHTNHVSVGLDPLKHVIRLVRLQICWEKLDDLFGLVLSVRRLVSARRHLEKYAGHLGSVINATGRVH